MKLLEFMSNFRMKNVVRNITGISDKRRALFVKSVDVKNIIGYKINGSFNVARVNFELH
jgi:hypothetical protein